MIGSLRRHSSQFALLAWCYTEGVIRKLSAVGGRLSAALKRAWLGVTNGRVGSDISLSFFNWNFEPSGSYAISSASPEGPASTCASCHHFPTRPAGLVGIACRSRGCFEDASSAVAGGTMIREAFRRQILLLSALGGLAGTFALPSSAQQAPAPQPPSSEPRTLVFSTNAHGENKAIPQWGLDTSWPSPAASSRATARSSSTATGRGASTPRRSAKTTSRSSTSPGARTCSPRSRAATSS